MVNRRAFIGLTTLIATAGCLDSPTENGGDDGGSGPSGPDPVEEFSAPNRDGSFPAHGTMDDGPPVEIRTRSEYLEVLETKGVPVIEHEHQAGTLMGLHVQLAEVPESFEDVAYGLALVSKAYWAWMLYEGELRPPSEWRPEDVDGDDDERYPPLLIEVNMYANGEASYNDDERAAWFTIKDEQLVDYVTGEIEAAEYEAAVRDGSKEP